MNTSNKRVLPKPDTRWLIIELLFASILYFIQIILKGNDINSPDATKNIFIIYAILLPSELIRQYVGTEEIKLLIKEISYRYTIYNKFINGAICLSVVILGILISTGTLIYVSIKGEKSLVFKVGFYVAILSLILETFIFTKALFLHYLRE